jgi:pimeloyl-ACP methyl ester carboxylesterase
VQLSYTRSVLRKLFRRLWHKTLNQPYRLFCRYDSGQGQPVVLLHGIASSGEVWWPIIALLDSLPCRVLAFDLLGFGRSPKPTDKWLHYTVEDHARAVINSLNSKRVGEKSVLVGHSMGCLVAIRVARIRPDLVSNLILYEPPFFTEASGSNVYQRKQKFYARIYNRLIKRPPSGLGRFRYVQKLVARSIGFELTEQTWIPFQRSMKHTILRQTAVPDLIELNIPTEIIYGKYDSVVINDKKRYFFDVAAENIKVSEIAATHAVSKRASILVYEQVRNLLVPGSTAPGLQQSKEISPEN